MFPLWAAYCLLFRDSDIHFFMRSLCRLRSAVRAFHRGGMRPALKQDDDGVVVETRAKQKETRRRRSRSLAERKKSDLNNGWKGR